MQDDALTVPRLRAAMAALAVASLDEILEPRTLALGPWWVRFESTKTLLWQLAQTARVEGIEDEAALQAECDVYTTLVPSDGLLVTLGSTAAPDAAAWRALVAALPTEMRLVCSDVAVLPSSVTPTGQTCRILFAITGALRACFTEQAGVLHCALQTRTAPVPEGVLRALIRHLEPS